MKKLVIISILSILVLCASFIFAANHLKVKITGIYSDMHQNKETHDIIGMELIIVLAGDSGQYYGIVQIAEGSPQKPYVTELKIQGNKIEFEDRPDNEDNNTLKFVGTVTDKGIKGEWVGGGFSVDMKRGQSYWQKN